MRRKALLCATTFGIALSILLLAGARLPQATAGKFEAHEQFVPFVSSPAGLDIRLITDDFDSESDVTDIEGLGDGRILVALKDGRIMVVDANGEILTEPFLDITGSIFSRGVELGLIGLALHPQYAQNSYFYVHYTLLVDGDIVSRIARFKAQTANQADPNSEIAMIDIPQDGPMHQGGALEFGPFDQMLYIGLGDGGTTADQMGHAQNGSLLKGKILRIDVNGAEPYTIPPDNPFIDDPEVLDEIWAMGLRNPWRIAFDSLTGDLFIGDVGEFEWEEINYQPGASPGGENYGWPCWDGPNINPDRIHLCEPGMVPTQSIHHYSHVDEHCAVIGGGVYRGALIPEIEGHFVYADLCARKIYSLLRQENGQWKNYFWGDFPYVFTTFGQRNNGELMVGAYMRVFDLVRPGSP